MMFSHNKSNPVTIIRKSNILRGTFILTLSGFTTRFLGFYNRIFLNSLIGSTQLGLYQLVMPIYMVLFAFTSSGIEQALTKLVSESITRKDIITVKMYTHIALRISIILGLLSAVFLYSSADFISVRFLHSPSCKSCLQILSLGVPFMAVKGSIHGFFLGKQQSSIHGISDCIEQLSKISIIYILSSFLIIQKNYTASFATYGIVFGEFLSCVYSIVMYYLQTKKAPFQKMPCTFNTQINNIHSQTPRNNQALLTFTKTALPFTTNRLFLTLLQSVESILIPYVLLQYYKNSEVSLSIYGLFTGIAFPCIMFPSTITNSLSTMLLPTVSSRKNNTTSLTHLCESSIAFCIRLGLFSMVNCYLLGPQLGVLLFHNDTIGQYITWLSTLCPFLYAATTLASLLNGLGYATHNLLLSVITTFIRIIFIITTIPQIGIRGYVLGLLVSYMTLTLLSISKLIKHTNLIINVKHCLFQPLAFIILTNYSINWCVSHILTPYIHNKTFLLIVTLIINAFLVFYPFIRRQYRK